MSYGQVGNYSSLSRIFYAQAATRSAISPRAFPARCFSQLTLRATAAIHASLDSEAAPEDSDIDHFASQSTAYQHVSIAPHQHTEHGSGRDGKVEAQQDVGTTQIASLEKEQSLPETCSQLGPQQMTSTSDKLDEKHGDLPTANTGSNRGVTPYMQLKAMRPADAHIYNSTRNSVLKDRSSWSYDWRVPLLDLRQHFQPDSAPLSDLGAFAGSDKLYRQFSAREVFNPHEWSQQAFAGYVRDLAQSEVSRLVNRHLYAGHTTHVLAVKELLLSLFKKPEFQPLITAEAFENALPFFYRYRMIDAARSLWNLTLERRFPIRAKTFNISLRATADQRDLHNFTYLLRSMINLGIRPSEDSWVSLIIALESHAAKKVVVENMRDVGLLRREDVVRAVAVQMLSSTLRKGLDGSIDDTLKQFDADYGRHWFSSGAANAICKHLCEAGMTLEALEFLNTMANRGCKPNQGTLDIFLGCCYRKSDPHLALRLLKLFWIRHGVFASETSHHMLFALAWQRKMYNMCKVLWWHACIEAKLTHRMQELTVRSLLRTTPRATANLSKVWMKEAGKLIVGIESGPRVHERSEASSRHETPLRRKVAQLAAKSDTQEDREAQLALVREILDADFSAWKQYRFYVDHFHQGLTRALSIDENWHKRGIVNISFERKLKEAVQLPVRPKVRFFGAPRRIVRKTVV